MHPLLRRQLKHCAVGEITPEWEAFIHAVDEAYEQSDADRQMVERSLDLSSGELLEANAALRERAVELARSNAELERFAEITSHDLQEPLRTITSYLQLLQRRYGEQFDADARQFIDFAANATQVMQQLIRDLLSLARITARGRPFAPVELGPLVDDVIATLSASITEAEASVRRGDLPTVVGDRSQLRQVFQNLLSNAVKFRRAGIPPAISIGADKAGAEWRCAVIDNGIGIEARYRERIFDLFQRLHTTDEYPGTGIGLAMCHKIVDRHGGRIGVDSEPGQGSTFWFTLPARSQGG